MNKQGTKQIILGFLPLLVYMVLLTLRYIIGSSYYAGLTLTCLVSLSQIWIIYTAAISIKSLWKMRKKVKQKVFIPLFSVSITITALLSGFVVFDTIQNIKPINIYQIDENTKMEKGTIYVTTNDTCEYCAVSYQNTLRAVNIYSKTHMGRIVVVNLNSDTELARDLDSKLDHYGSVVRMDDNGTLHELAYTIADQNGNPKENTPSDIFNRIKKVAE